MAKAQLNFGELSGGGFKDYASFTLCHNTSVGNGNGTTDNTDIYTLPGNTMPETGSSTQTITIKQSGTYRYILVRFGRGVNGSCSCTIGGTSITIDSNGIAEGEISLNANDSCSIFVQGAGHFLGLSVFLIKV